MKLFRDTCEGYKSTRNFFGLEPRFNQHLNFNEVFEQLQEGQPHVLRNSVSNLVYTDILEEYFH